MNQRELKKLYEDWHIHHLYSTDVFKCELCGKYYKDWYVPFSVWTRVTGDGTLCKRCFRKLAKRKGITKYKYISGSDSRTWKK